MTSTEEETSPEAGVAQLKAQRKSPGTRPKKSVLNTPPPPGEHRSPMTAALQRKNVLLFDPSEHPAVVQSSGVITGAILTDRYDVAESDFVENIVPANCKTAISIERWHTGDLVRKDVYARWLKEYGPAEVVVELPADEVTE